MKNVRWLFLLVSMMASGIALGLIVSMSQADEATAVVPSLPLGVTTRVSVSGATTDPNFGVAGRAVTNLSENSWANDVIVQPDDKILVAGAAANGNFDADAFALARYNPDGSPDTTFGGGTGVITTRDTPFGQLTEIQAITLLTNGNILAVGLTEFHNNFVVVRYRSDGSLDSTFGTGGVVATNILPGAIHIANDIAVNPASGKIVVAGTISTSNSSMAVVRYWPGGALDTTFDGDGIVTTTLGLNTEGTAVAIQPDSKIVVAGATTFSGVDIVVTRYDITGTLDSTFGNTGWQSIDFLGGEDRAYDIALQADNKIIVGGSAVNGLGANEDFALARLDSFGFLDMSFDGDGLVTTDLNQFEESIQAIHIQSGNKIVVAGYSGWFSETNFAFARYLLDDGSLDTSFASGTGYAIMNLIDNNEKASGLDLQGDDKLVFAGIGGQRFGAGRLHPDGLVDNSFDFDGWAPFFVGNGLDFAHAMVIQADDKIVIGGGSPTDNDVTDFALVRYTSDGQPDGTFGQNGRVRTDFFNSYDEIEDLVLQPDGNIVAAGHAVNISGTNGVALARYDTNGNLDPTFGSGGLVTTSRVDWLGARGKDATRQPDGKIIVVGTLTNFSESTDLLLLRYENDGTLDSSFGTGGFISLTLGLGSSMGEAVGLQSDGKILVAGSALDQQSSQDWLVARFLPNGTLDTTFGTGGIRLLDSGGDDLFRRYGHSGG